MTWWCACEPVWMQLQADFNPRGNVHTVVRVCHGTPPGLLSGSDLRHSAGEAPAAASRAGSSPAKAVRLRLHSPATCRRPEARYRAC